MSARDDANRDAQPAPVPARARPGNRRAELVAVAAGLFGKHGYRGVGVNDVAAAAGISGPALYRHFASKQDLLAHVLLSALDTLNDVAGDVLESAPEQPRERLLLLTGALAELSMDRRDSTALWRWQGAHLSEEGRRAVRDRGARLLGCFTRQLRACRPELEAADGELLCWAALSVLGSVAVHRTRISKRRHVELLRTVTMAVLDTDLPDPDSPPAGNGEHRSLPEWAASQAVRATRRETLLTEATRLFRRRGFHAVSIEEIGQAAGLAPASVYRHFSGKPDLLVTMCHRMADRLAADADRVVAASHEPAEALTALLASYVDTFTRNVDLVSVYLTEVANLPGPERAELVRLQRAYVSRWVALLRASRPELDEAAARVTVHATLTVVNDLPRTRQTSARPHLDSELLLLGKAALGAATSGVSRR